MTKLNIFLSVVAAFLTLSVHADPRADELAFRNLFLGEVTRLNPKAEASQIESLHLMSDAAIDNMLNAGTINEAMTQLSKTNLVNLVMETKPFAGQRTGVNLAPLSAGLTIVLVPGVFAEFIDNRAFEEVLERPSQFREQFKKLVADQKVTDSVQTLENYRKDRPVNEVAANESRPLDKVLNVGEMNINGTQVKVVLFYTEFLSLESLGANQDRARIFNRRLQKYLDLTGPQTLALLGYSRGTPLALEMLAQAKAAGKPWVNDVKAMISLSGVVSGSSLADSAIEDQSAPTNKLLVNLQTTVANLKPIDDSHSIFYPANAKIAFYENLKTWSDFVTASTPNIATMIAETPRLKSVSELSSLLQTDPRSPLSLAMRVWAALGLNHPLTSYNMNIVRFSYFVDQLIVAVKELTTSSRMAWWQSHNLPLNVTYYAIPAAMANPDADDTQLAMFQNPLAYGGKANYDDDSLLVNVMDYIKITKASLGEGVSLNDSQVAVAQSAFLPQVIANANPENAGIKTKFLGIAGTHHWGMALRVVDKNNFSATGGRNGFPREAMLRALATQVMRDYYH